MLPTCLAGAAEKRQPGDAQGPERPMAAGVHRRKLGIEQIAFPKRKRGKQRSPAERQCYHPSC